MAYSFSAACRVLRFAEGGRPEHWAAERQGDRRGQQWIAVPALAWTIQAEVRTMGPLNAFQRAVLTLCHMGIVLAEHQAAATGLDRALVAFVGQELMAEGLLTPSGELMLSGLKALQEDRELPVRTVQLHVFQDPWSGELWPRVVKRMEVAPTVGEADTFAGDPGRLPWPRLDMSTPGRDHTVPLRFLTVSGVALGPPSLPAVGAAIEAWMASRRGTGDLQALAGNPEDAIEVSDAEAEPVWLATQIYVPDDGVFERRWRVADPFVPGDLPWLRRRLREVATRGRGHPPLLSVISQLVGSADGGPLDSEAEELRVLTRFGADLMAHEDLKEYVENLLAAESALTDPNGDLRRARRAEESAATSCGKVLEYMLPRLLRAFPVLGGAVRAREVLEHGLDQLRWGRCPPAWTPEKLHDGNLMQSRDLVACLARTCVAAVQHNHHPLRRWMRPPRTVADLDSLRTWRNAHSHARMGKRSTLSNVDHCHRIESVLEFVELHLSALPKE